MILRCPKCGYISDLDGFDVIGVDADKLFCPQCSHHGRMRELTETPERLAAIARQNGDVLTIKENS